MSKKRRRRETHIEILYEDNHFIAVNKPAGVLVHSDETGDETLVDAIKEYIKVQYKKPGDVFLGVIHRIDRPVSGVVLFARTSKGLTRMNKLFQDRKVSKSYRAVVNKKPDPLEGTIETYLSKDAKKNKAHVHTSSKKGGKLSTTEYKLKAGLNGYFYLEINPVTGRPHQIRIHLAHFGTPIVGDLKYGYSRPTQNKSICLHCYSLSFQHPVTLKHITIKTEPPTKEYWSFFVGM